MKRYIFLLTFSIVTLLFAPFASAEDWYQQDSGTEQPLFAVWFTSEREGWAVGGPGLGMPDFPSGVILHSTDSGLTWEAQDSPSDGQLFDVCFADANHGWAVGADTIIHTTNGGESWEAQSLPFVTSFWDISCFPNSNTVYVVGAIGEISTLHGAVLKTTNGGVTWVSLDSGIDDTLFGSYFVDEEHGYIVGGGGSISRTDNGGDSFESLDQLTRYSIPVGLNDIYCFSMDDCWVVGSGEFVYHTTNGGESWGEALNTGFTVSGLNSIGVKDEDHVWFTGQSTLRHTDDGGATWLIDPTDITIGSLELLDVPFMRDVMFVGNVGWAVGDNGVILRTGELTTCEEIPNWCEDNDHPFTTQYDEVTGCPIGYLCAVIDNPGNPTIATDEEEEPTCQEEYRACVEEEWPNYDNCDAWEFCDNTDEELASVEKEHAKKSFDSAGGYGYFKNFMKGEDINIYFTEKDGSVSTFGLTFVDGAFVVVDAYEKPTVKVSLSAETVASIEESKNPKKAALDAVANGDIDIQGVGLKTMKIFFLKAGLKLTTSFVK